MINIPRIGIVSLGCAKNLVDTERLTSALVAMGYEIENDYNNCDLVIVNTCGFINQAQQESLEAIQEAMKQTSKVIVMGCLGKKASLIYEKFPKVCKVYGPGLRTSVLRGVKELLGVPPASARQHVEASGILLTPPHYAYLKIAEGCRHRCSFCIIPQLRGPLHSRDVDAIFKEARDLTLRGVRELLIIAQDSSDYGFDLKNGTSLSSLCKALAPLKRWLRLHYVYPSAEADKVVELMAENIVLPYLDVPFQHANEQILRAMRRPGNIEKTLKTIEKWRSICPDIALRSTFITGFPGETETMFNDLLSFLKEAKLDRVGVFPYSNVDGAFANSLDNQVPEEVREERAQLLMDLQATISREKLLTRVGKSYDVIIDNVSEDGIAVGRTKYEAPDIDGVVVINDAKNVECGDIVRATITATDEHDMQATLQSVSNGSIPFQVQNK